MFCLLLFFVPLLETSVHFVVKMQNGNGTANGVHEPMKVDDPALGAKLPDVDMSPAPSSPAPTAPAVEVTRTSNLI